ncbi:MAG: hypothetical protein C0405_02090 [Desulfovibrio sp.]|nr:hypothetical protein [Desulfovibrio sp.]
MNSVPDHARGPRRLREAALALSLALTLAFLPAAPAQAASARETAGSIIDSLTNAPAGQEKSATGFPQKPAKPGAAQTGPRAPVPPKVPVVKELPSGPTGSQPAGSPLSDAPSSTTQPAGQPVWPVQPSAPQRRLPAQPANPSAPKTRPAAVEPRQREEVLTLEHDGRERRAVLRMPRMKAQNKGQRGPLLPLVIFLHGAGGTASQAMRQTGLGGLAERAGFIAVFPDGLAGPPGQESGGIQTWNAWMCCGYARDQRIDDVGYLAALINRLKADYPVDPRRIHLAGFSNGAMLASRFALERPGSIASIASVAGYLPCDAQVPQEPLPVLVIHGDQDRVARFGPTAAYPRTGRFCEDYPAKAQVEFWVRGMGLKARPQQVQDGRKSRTRVERYGQKGRGSVAFVIVKGGGHAWPGGPREHYRYCDLPSPDPDATALIWDFFKRQARPGPPEKANKAEKPRQPDSSYKKDSSRKAKGKARS